MSAEAEADLLGAVLARPDDDGPRLAYAAWLEKNGGKHGRARAEFIRVESLLTRLEAACCCGGAGPASKRCPACREATPLRRREKELLAAADLPGWMRAPPAAQEVLSGNWLLTLEHLFGAPSPATAGKPGKAARVAQGPSPTTKPGLLAVAGKKPAEGPRRKRKGKDR